MTLRALISIIVRAEVQDFERRRAARRFDRVLSRGEIERGVEAGKVAPEGRETPPAPPVEEAVSSALLAFQDGMYLVAIDGREYRDLDAQIFVTPDSRVAFIRLVFLAGA